MGENGAFIAILWSFFCTNTLGMMVSTFTKVANSTSSSCDQLDANFSWYATW
jgi:hypothetical protein